MDVDSSMGLKRFLSTSKENFMNYSENGNVTVVMGNESCDLDSAVSSIVYAYFMYTTLSCKDENVGNIVIPILNVEKTNYPVKTEVKYFLSTNNICEDDLVFRDEIDLKDLFNKKKLKLVLVDHHVLQIDYKNLESAVIKVLDHRPVDVKSKWSKDIAKIELVGSCCTLVGDEILKYNKSILSKNSDIALLIYGTIILDTKCFSDVLQRHTKLDRKVADECKTLGKIDTLEEEFWNQLEKSKGNVSHLTPKQLLVKDMKLVKCIPISTLTTSVETFISKIENDEHIQSFCEEYNAPILIILGVGSEGDVYRRDVFIYRNEKHTHDKIKDNGGVDEFLECILRHLKDYTLLDLTFIKDFGNGHLFTQKNVKLTRKHILPIIENAYCDFMNESIK